MPMVGYSPRQVPMVFQGVWIGPAPIPGWWPAWPDDSALGRLAHTGLHGGVGAWSRGEFGPRRPNGVEWEHHLLGSDGGVFYLADGLGWYIWKASEKPDTVSQEERSSEDAWY